MHCIAYSYRSLGAKETMQGIRFWHDNFYLLSIEVYRLTYAKGLAR